MQNGERKGSSCSLLNSAGSSSVPEHLVLCSVLCGRDSSFHIQKYFPNNLFSIVIAHLWSSWNLNPGPWLKGQLLPYTSANLTLDLVMLFLYLGVEIMRIFFGSKGNLCQRKVPLTISLLLVGPSTIMAVYYMLLQTYVLKLEVTINAILLVFYVFELVLYIVGLISFSSVIVSD
ncbi:transmembrane protein 216-like isoform X2 [Stegostoma tigrinum]|uniref:transmembrane protein 216-like isoform X2 n=1 Tax=Stegostoma tigrinum TaxID=3053191 RepID=UPI00202B2FC1|nr:transmembrane protein 216-like isoform X2 [Stegostoma tigrinum]